MLDFPCMSRNVVRECRIWAHRGGCGGFQLVEYNDALPFWGLRIFISWTIRNSQYRKPVRITQQGLTLCNTLGFPIICGMRNRNFTLDNSMYHTTKNLRIPLNFRFYHLKIALLYSHISIAFGFVWWFCRWSTSSSRTLQGWFIEVCSYTFQESLGLLSSFGFSYFSFSSW